MRDLVPSLPALVLPATGAPPPSKLSGLVADLDGAFLALEDFIGDAVDVSDIAEFRRLDELVDRAVERIADAEATDLNELRAKAGLILSSAAIREDDGRSSVIGASLGLDVLRLLGPGGRT